MHNAQNTFFTKAKNPDIVSRFFIMHFVIFFAIVWTGIAAASAAAVFSAYYPAYRQHDQQPEKTTYNNIINVQYITRLKKYHYQRPYNKSRHPRYGALPDNHIYSPYCTHFAFYRRYCRNAGGIKQAEYKQ